MVLLASLLVLGAALTGCVGQSADDPTKASNVDGGGDGKTGGDDGGVTPPAELKVLAPLTTAVSMTGPKWVAAGTKVPVGATAPANAKGALTYTWAIGPLPGTAAVTSANLNTKEILAGASATLKFDKAGVYNMHCHPHPFMLSNVTVIEGYSGPAEVTVYINDGASTGEFRYVPDLVVIPVGGKVTYKNVGTQMHTATQSGQEPPLTKDGLTGLTGEVAASGAGWQRILLVAQDGEGRIGKAETRVYVADLPKDFVKDVTGDFMAGVPNQAPPEAATEKKTDSFKLDHPGLITVNFTAVSPGPAAGTPAEAANVAAIELHLKEQGATQDTLTQEAASDGSMAGRVGAKTYELSILPRQGANIHYEVSITVVYDLVPPEPSMAPAAGVDGHAHQH
jgi:plastocyanin